MYASHSAANVSPRLMSCNYKSRSSFFRAFKAHTRTTFAPRESRPQRFDYRADTDTLWCQRRPVMAQWHPKCVSCVCVTRWLDAMIEIAGSRASNPHTPNSSPLSLCSALAAYTLCICIYTYENSNGNWLVFVISANNWTTIAAVAVWLDHVHIFGWVCVCVATCVDQPVGHRPLFALTWCARRAHRGRCWLRPMIMVGLTQNAVQ